MNYERYGKQVIQIMSENANENIWQVNAYEVKKNGLQVFDVNCEKPMQTNEKYEEIRTNESK